MAIFGFDDKAAIYDATPVENMFITQYLPAANGDHVRVYLYGLMQCHHPVEGMSVEQMARDLNLTEEQVMNAFRHWEFHGLVRRISDKPPVWRYLPVLQQSLMNPGRESDPAYMAFAESLCECFGDRRQLHGAETTLAYEWVEAMGLPAEVVIVMIRHLINTAGPNFSFKTTGNKTASHLKDENALTVEAAMELLAMDEKAEKEASAIVRHLGGRRRTATKDEINLYRKWVSVWHFTFEAVEAACAATVKTNNPSFAYLDAVLKRLHEQGVRASTAEQMERALAASDDRAAPVRQLLRTLRMPDTAYSEAVQAVYYGQLRSLYPDSVIQLAAESAARGRRSCTLDDVIALLEAWQKRGLATEEDVRAYLQQYQEETALLSELGLRWGRTPSGQQAHDTLRRWRSEWGFSDEMIRACAEYAAGTERPLAYLNSLLETYQKLRITTPEQAAEERRAWRSKAAPAQQKKLLPAQQYAQRDYSGADEAGLPDWVMQRWKEMYGDAK